MDRQSLFFALLQPTADLSLSRGGVFPSSTVSSLFGSTSLDLATTLGLIRAEAALEEYRGAMLKEKLAAVRTLRLKDVLLAATALASEDAPSLFGPSRVIQETPEEKVPPLFLPQEEEAEKPKKRSQRKKPRNAEDSFPYKLFHMLKETEKDGQEDIISFLPHDKAFRVHKPDLFAREVLPCYFNTNRMASFQKQLGVYGFKRMKEGLDKGAITREHFHRDATIEELLKIQRKKQRVPLGESVSQRRERVVAWKGATSRMDEHDIEL